MNELLYDTIMIVLLVVFIFQFRMTVWTIDVYLKIREHYKPPARI
jgi:hypothetical protein